MSDLDDLSEAFSKDPIDLTPQDIETVVQFFRSQYMVSSNQTGQTVRKSAKPKGKQALSAQMLEDLNNIPLGDLIGD